MKTKADPTTKLFLISLPVLDRSENDDAAPTARTYTIRAASIDDATETFDDLLADDWLAEEFGLDPDEGSLEDQGYILGTPSVVEVIGEAVGIEEIEA